ncbi:glycerophosphodiester phosphodiesterase [Streptomyces sp. 7-21]|uniref:glycerophosphodiester phosphodiesterase n=1 Tax=Streptomyces sp. 7-21 TaxID=2802283 RepID=UPI00191E4C05|nr:glycerophosphodiester phosphodiesterase [Streptomyces sp. 7-21]MBL1067947.1 glycerophosphodiester phosphodiesterase [Streptomyces sp. 7-21]
MSVRRRAPGEIQVVAHRGSSEDAPEHTLAAYRKAIADGADALECDVRMTADGHLVCVHDRRVNRTSNGRGAVASMELADLAELDFGSWRGSAGRDETPDSAPDAADPERTAVLTLERLLRLVADAGRPVGLAIETKHPSRWAGRVEERLLELLRAYELPGPVRVMSFSARSLQRIRLAAPELPTVYLMRFVLPRHRSGRLPAAATVAGPSVRVLRRDPGYVERAHRAGHEVHVWTVDEPEDVDLCARLGVDAIITNRPLTVRERLGRAGG